MKSKSIEEFYEEIAGDNYANPCVLLPNGIQKEIGHFNVFSIKEL
jgi:AraC family transcriptional activator of pobA